MKKILVAISAVAIVSIYNYSQAQTNTFPSSGNVGIGTTSPGTKLDVLGVTTIRGGGYLRLGAYNVSTDNFGYISSAGGSNGTGLKFETPASGNALGVTRMVITNEGKVGIGTTAPGTFMLAVEGKIGAREIKVTTVTPWPDYVFEKQYPRMSLKELENYIEVNKHLPNIISAKEVEKERGFDLGAMQVKHLEKTEELYLYVIELNNTILELQKKIEELELKHKK